MTELRRHPQLGGIVDELRSIVGAEHVLVSPAELDRYSRCTIPWQRSCAAVVFPASTDEVAELLQVSVRHNAALWPFSTGRNWGYGTTLATEHGVIVMILERMNQIIEVNDDLAYAVLEPGVTYEQLNAYLKAHGYELWIDCIDGTPKGSVIGNALERGVGQTPYGDHFANLCGLEVVLPDGQRIWTGGGPGRPKTWHTHKWGVGPYLEGLFSQSNMGIVTRAGVWLMPRPEAYNSFVFEIGDERHLPEVLVAFRRLALQGVITTKIHVINDVVSLTLLTQRIAERNVLDGSLSDAELAALRRKYKIAPWSCGGGLYGPRAQVKLQRAMLRKALSGHGRLLFLSDARIALVKRMIAWSDASPRVRTCVQKVMGASLAVMELAPHVHDVLRGIPTEHFVKHAYFRHRRPRPDVDVDPVRDRCGLIWFAPILPLEPLDVIPFLADCRQRFSASGFDFYVAMLLMNPRSIICLMSIMYDKEDKQQTADADDLYEELVTSMQEQGYEQYRVALCGWHRTFEASPELLELNDRIKAALDPHNVLAPGRYGIGSSR